VLLLIGASAPPAPGADQRGYYAQPAFHGNTLVFQAAGDLWTAQIPAAGERVLAQRLTSAPGTESRPVMSPNGAQVAYAGSFDGNAEVFVLPVQGGTPKRLTVHPGRDMPVAWSPDGASVLIRSDRAHPHGEYEFFTVPAEGGPVTPLPFGEGMLGSFNRASGELAFNPFSNENWYWKGYRGGTTPDIWLADAAHKNFQRVTNTPENELFPMWIGDRIFFLADTSGRMNIWSCKRDGSDRAQHTKAGANDFDLRWPSADASGAGRVAYAQGGDLYLLDTANNSTRKLNIDLQGDRLDGRQRMEKAGATLTQLALSPDASRVAVVSRGEVLIGPVGKPKSGVPQAWLQLPGLSGSREGGVSWTGAGDLILVSDQGGEASIVSCAGVAQEPGAVPTMQSLVRGDRWLFAPQASPDGSLIAFGDKSLRLRVLDVKSKQERVVGTSPAGEITDYRFSPAGRWLAWVATMPNGFGRIHIYDTKESKDVAVGNGLTDDRLPRWDPKGLFLYMSSARAINPELDQFDLAFATRDSWQFLAVPLRASQAPPVQPAAAMANFDVAKWAAFPPEKEDDESATPAEAKVAKPLTVEIDFDGFMSRAVELPVEAGTFRDVNATCGGLVFLRVPQTGVVDEEWPPPVLGPGGAKLERLDLSKGETKPLLEDPVNYASISGDARSVVVATTSGASIKILALSEPGEPTVLDLGPVDLLVDVAAEWAQIYDEAWRLQRDFFWKPDLGGVDWAAVRAKYAVLLPRIGTRAELNDLVGEMSAELGTSHTYISGGDSYAEAPPSTIGLLGIDVSKVAEGFRIDAILPGDTANGGPESPLAAPHRGVSVGDVIVAIDGRSAVNMNELGELLRGRAGKPVSLSLRQEAGSVRTVEVNAVEDETALRYARWVNQRRAKVAAASGGRLGYMHLPDMDSAGLVAFVRNFYPQYLMDGMVIDERWNRGGYVSQMILERLRRKPIARDVPREGTPGTYPVRAASGPMAMLVNERSGSDGDIFPTGFRLYGLGPVIGVRTWGGVVGIRSDKPFVDGGGATQPEFAWWDAAGGFTMENHGVDPDIVVPHTPADTAAGRDPQLDRAIAELLPKLDAPKPPAPPVPSKDNTSRPPAST
jgi:tricorn protease